MGIKQTKAHQNMCTGQTEETNLWAVARPNKLKVIFAQTKK